jgi:hypothetical protein
MRRRRMDNQPFQQFREINLIYWLMKMIKTCLVVFFSSTSIFSLKMSIFVA